MDLEVGGWRLRLGAPGAVPPSVPALRAATFRDGADDGDAWDATARHLTVERDGALAACARLWAQDGTAMAAGYSGQFYDLAPLAARHPRAVEVGRVCLARPAPDLPRLLLGALARVVDGAGADLLYGCASARGETPPPALGALAARAAPWGPRRAAGAEAVALPAPGPGPLPAMLRLYLAFGASVSDHAVVDRDLGTVHVLAMLPMAAIPAARASLLRAMLAA